MIGVMQGRLSPPEGGKFQSFPSEWWKEFPRAVEAGVEFIEWIVDSNPNPLFSDSGVVEINEFKAKYNIQTPSICADFIMDLPLHGDPNAWKRSLGYLLVRAPLIGAKRVILPFVDNMRMASMADEFGVIGTLEQFAGGVELHIECDLEPERFRAFLLNCPQGVKANWDSGNSSGLGYVASEEFAAYGHRIGSIHIKDRYRKPEGGIETRPLGQGSADFDDIFQAIRSVDYRGDYTLQVARGEPGDEINWIRKQAEFLRERLK